MRLSIPLYPLCYTCLTLPQTTSLQLPGTDSGHRQPQAWQAAGKKTSSPIYSPVTLAEDPATTGTVHNTKRGMTSLAARRFQSWDRCDLKHEREHNRLKKPAQGNWNIHHGTDSRWSMVKLESQFYAPEGHRGQRSPLWDTISYMMGLGHPN